MTTKNVTKKKIVQEKNRRLELLLLAGISFITLGLLLGGFEIMKTWLTQDIGHSNAQLLVSNKAIETPAPLVSGKPTHITIQSVHIDLDVIPGYYDASNQSWTLSTDKAQWGVSTVEANNKSGLTYIYAHYRKNVFYTLPQISAGDEAIIATENGHTFRYTFKSSSITKPTDTSVFDYKGAPVLILQTCNGIWYENRQLFVFELAGYK